MFPRVESIFRIICFKVLIKGGKHFVQRLNFGVFSAAIKIVS